MTTVISTQVNRLESSKQNMRTAIAGKGVSIPSSVTLDNYDAYINLIESGGIDLSTAVGTWRWVPRLDWNSTFLGDTGDDNYYINFTSNGNSYTKMELDIVGYELYYGSTVAARVRSSISSPSTNQTIWNNDNYRTIVITGGNDVKNATLLNILKNNAIKLV